MPQSLATVIYVLGIGGLFWLDRDRKARTSPALWISVIWLWIIGSREFSQWLAIAGVGGASGDSGDPYLEGNPIDRIVYAGLIALGLIVLIKRGRTVRRLLRANIPILLFFGYCALSVLWSDYSLVAFKRWTKAVGDLVMVLIVLTDRDWESALKRVLARVGFLLIPLSVLFIKYYPQLAREYKFWSGKAMYSGITTTKNLLGVICLVYGLGSLWRILTTWQNQEKDSDWLRRIVPHGVILAMVAWLLWTCNSMTSISCILLAAVLMIAMNLRAIGRRPTIVHLLVAVVVAVSISVLFLNVGGAALEEMGRDRSLTGRTAIWDLVLGLAGNPVCGTGFESFWLGWRLEKVWSVMIGIQEAHNGYLEVYLNLGWIGLTLLGVIIVTGYHQVVATLRTRGGTSRLWLTYVVVALVYSFTEAGFRMMFPVWFFFLMATMAVKIKQEPSERLPAIPGVDDHPQEEPPGYSTDEGRLHGTLVGV